MRMYDDRSSDDLKMTQHVSDIKDLTCTLERVGHFGSENCCHSESMVRLHDIKSRQGDACC